jgi:hypothetical protein
MTDLSLIQSQNDESLVSEFIRMKGFVNQIETHCRLKTDPEEFMLKSGLIHFLS